jgi:hypothetical protein
MKLRMTMVFVSVLAFGSLVSSGIAGAGTASTATPTKVTIKGPQGDFEGRIRSEDPNCLGDRKVTVFRQKGKEQDLSTDQRIASDTSDVNGNHGEWSVGNTGQKNGRFYARAAKAPGCKAGSSPTIKLVDGVQQ